MQFKLQNSIAMNEFLKKFTPSWEANEITIMYSMPPEHFLCVEALFPTKFNVTNDTAVHETTLQLAA
jgi:hypothetical protein